MKIDKSKQRERERVRERERGRERGTQREREREGEKGRGRERERETEGRRVREREGGRERERMSDQWNDNQQNVVWRFYDSIQFYVLIELCYSQITKCENHFNRYIKQTAILRKRKIKSVKIIRYRSELDVRKAGKVGEG